MAYRFEIHKDKTGQFRVRFKYSGEIIFSTEAYTTKASARKAIKSIKEKGPAAPVEDLTVAAPVGAGKPARASAVKTPSSKTAPAKRSSKSTVATVAAKPVAAVKAAAIAVRSAVETAVKTTAKRKT